ncbi:MAG: hypothetical protein J4F48_04560, partial [Nitrospinae bacterium]|nr:hypothetical protein [Nitrospinota bacterium]
GKGEKQTSVGHNESGKSAGGAAHGANSQVKEKSGAPARSEKSEGETAPGGKNGEGAKSGEKEKSGGYGASSKSNVARNASIAGANQTGRDKR